MTFRYEDLIEETANRTGYSKETVRRVINHQFLFIRDSMYYDFTGRILIHGLGSWTMPVHKVEQMIRRVIKDYRDNKITKTDVRRRVKALWKTRRKLKNLELSPKRRKIKKRDE